ncbi:MAG: hypothetical protein ACAI44_26690 [Candidatus Sericytochromatia bacterium]
MAISRNDYPKTEIEAAHAVMLELFHLLGAYREQIALIGGWVPYLLLPGSEPAHVGSTDIDLALNHLELGETDYRTIGQLLQSRGYQRSDAQPFSYHRTFEIASGPITVQVDLLAGEYQGTGRKRRTQRVQDVQPRKARGCDLVFEQCEELSIQGNLPGGGLDRERIRVAGIAPFLVMKSMALRDRMKEKDAYDIYYCLKNWPSGPSGVAAAFAAIRTHGLVDEAFGILDEKFHSPEFVGCRFVSDFEDLFDPEDMELLRRDVYEQVHAFLLAVGQRKE